MHTSVRTKAHQMQFLSFLLGIGIGSLYLWVFYDRTVLASTVNLDKVLINDTTSTNIKVSYL